MNPFTLLFISSNMQLFDILKKINWNDIGAIANVIIAIIALVTLIYSLKQSENANKNTHTTIVFQYQQDIENRLRDLFEYSQKNFSNSTPGNTYNYEKTLKYENSEKFRLNFTSEKLINICSLIIEKHPHFNFDNSWLKIIYSNYIKQTSNILKPFFKDENIGDLDKLIPKLNNIINKKD